MVFYNINTVPVDKTTFNDMIKFCNDNEIVYYVSKRNDKSHNYYHYINVDNNVVMVAMVKLFLKTKRK